MSSLPNAKHERFAQALADGKTQLEAHEIAGYKPHRSTASALAHDPNISERVTEILGERAEVQSQGTAQAIEKVALTKEWVLATLIENVQRAMTATPVMIHDGDEWVNSGEYKYEGAIANRSLELLGKELGMFIDRKEIRSGPLNETTDDELDRIIRRSASEAQVSLGASGEGSETQH